MTNRERQILLLFARGHEKPQIAKRLGISQSTVRNVVSSIFDRLQAANIRHAVAIALRDRQISAVDLIIDVAPLVTDRKPKRKHPGRRGAGGVRAFPSSVPGKGSSSA